MLTIPAVFLAAHAAGDEALKGTFYDLTKTVKGEEGLVVKSSCWVSPEYCTETKKWVMGDYSGLKRFASSPAKDFTHLHFPCVSCVGGAEIFGVSSDMSQNSWAVVYRGRVKAPTSGRFRFVCAADDLMSIRFDNNLVLEAGYCIPTMYEDEMGNKRNGEGLVNFVDICRQLRDRMQGDNGAGKLHEGYSVLRPKETSRYNSDFGGLIVGKEFNVQAGRSYPIEILFVNVAGNTQASLLLRNEAEPDSLQLFRVSGDMPDRAKMVDNLRKKGVLKTDELPNISSASLVWKPAAAEPPADYDADSEDAAAVKACRRLLDALKTDKADNVRKVAAETKMAAARWEGRPMLCYAQSGAAVNALLGNGANPDAVTRDGTPVLVAAVAAKRVGAVRALLAAGANTNVCDSWSSTPLITAALSGNEEMVKLLLEEGVDPAYAPEGTPNAAAQVQDSDLKNKKQILRLLKQAAAENAEQKEWVDSGLGMVRRAEGKKKDKDKAKDKDKDKDKNKDKKQEAPAEREKPLAKVPDDPEPPTDISPQDSSISGTFYDLTQDAKGNSNGFREKEDFYPLMMSLANKHDRGLLKKYYRSPNKAKTPYFCVPPSAPKVLPMMFACEEKCSGEYCVALYRARVIAPKSGKFRFVGAGDDVMCVRFGGKTVLECGYFIPGAADRNNLKDCMENGRKDNEAGKRFRAAIASGKDKKHAGYEYIPIKGTDTYNSRMGGMTAGSVFTVKAGEAYTIEVMIANASRDAGMCLLIQEVTTAAHKARGRYDLFRTASTLPDANKLRELLRSKGLHRNDDIPQYYEKSLIWRVSSEK